MLVKFPVYLNTQLYVEKESDLTWQKVNEYFLAKDFAVDLED